MTTHWHLVAYNTETIHAVGSERDACRYCAWLNRIREINVYSIERAEPPRGHATCRGCEDPVVLRDEFAAIQSARTLGKRGGHARAAAMTPAQRSETARTTVRARWDARPVVIDHESYGMSTRFSSLAEAQTTIRSCGSDFAATTLRMRGSDVMDEDGQIVGHVAD